MYIWPMWTPGRSDMGYFFTFDGCFLTIVHWKFTKKCYIISYRVKIMKEGSVMNGEMSQICMLVNAARKAIRESSDFYYENDDYVDSVVFHFLPKKKMFRTESYVAHNANEWFQHCMKEKCLDMKMLCPLKVDNRSVLGFSNTGGSSIVVFNDKSKVTYWTARWEFSQNKQMWDVTYTENEWPDAPDGKPSFSDNTVEFKKILTEIADFADKIECSNFGSVFRSALAILEGREAIPELYPSGAKVVLPKVSDHKRRMLFASSKADVFGAMGSWNDSPPYYASDKGLEDQYNQLSDELLQQIRLAMLYAINED